MADYKIVKFVQCGNEYCVPGLNISNVDVLVVGGGGAGGRGRAGNYIASGGGGGGEVIECFCMPFCATQPHSIIVGEGGSKWGSINRNGGYPCGGQSGLPSSAFGITAWGGGFGAQYAASSGNTVVCYVGNSKGTGGGGSACDCVGPGTGRLGGDGGAGAKGGTCCYAGGGGGGAGGNGGAAASGTRGGNGGPGKLSVITGCKYGGGGGGAYGYKTGVSGVAGCGCDGGGNGGTIAAGCDATYYGGGGGGAGTNCIGCGGNGCGGIVVVRYPTDGSYKINFATGGDCCYCCNGYCHHVFLGSGTFNVVC